MAGGAGVTNPGKGKTLRRHHCSLPVVKESLQKIRRAVLCQGMLVIWQGGTALNEKRVGLDEILGKKNVYYESGEALEWIAKEAVNASTCGVNCEAYKAKLNGRLSNLV